MRLLKGLSERHRLRREHAQAQRKFEMLTGAHEPRNTLPWDFALAFFVGGICTALIVLATLVWG